MFRVEALAIGLAVATGLGAVVGYFGAQFGFFMIVVGFFAGTIIAEALDRTVGIKRGPRILALAITGIDTAVDVFNRLGLPLVVAGDGPDQRRLRRLAAPNVRFAGRVSDAEAARLMAGCKAFLLTGVEEFGIAAVEAQAAGRPVIARHGGGALETVIEGVTGCYWSGAVDELAEAVRSFDADAVDPAACVENARRFEPERFRRALARETELAAAESGAEPDDSARERRVVARSRMPGTRRAWGVPAR